jgi:hypothetical protein
MAAIVELKYFNTFWLKKIKQITQLKSTAVAIFDNESALTITVTPVFSSRRNSNECRARG